MTSFELVPDDEQEDEQEDDGVPASAGTRDGYEVSFRDRLARRWRHLSRRGRVAVAGTTAVVVLAATTAVVLPGALDARDQRLRAQAVRGLPGIVDDLSRPPEETWTQPAGATVTGVLPDGVLLVANAERLTAVDAETGDQVWRHDFDGDVECGPTPLSEADWGTPVESVVCVSDAGSTVTVLDPAGGVLGERTLKGPRLVMLDEDTAGRKVWPAADGAIAVLEAAPSITVPWQEGDDPEQALEALRGAGWSGPTLRIEDAVTGALRGEVELELTAEALDGCGVTEESGVTGLSPDVWVDTTPSLTSFNLCSTTRTVLPDGTVVDLDKGLRAIASRPGGGYVVSGETSELLDDLGNVDQTITGWAVPVPVDSAPDGPQLTVLGASGESSVLATVGDDGNPVWTRPGAMLTSPLARVGDTLALLDESAVVGLDASTGEQRWRLTGLVDCNPESAEGGESVFSVVTDGTRLLLAVSPNSWSEDMQQNTFRLIALDLRDGTTTWEGHLTGNPRDLHSVGGRLVTAGNGVAGLG